MEQLRSDETGVSGEYRELETDSDEAEEQDSCQEVTCLEEIINVIDSGAEEQDELAGEVELVQPMVAEPRDELADFQEVELLRAEEMESGPLAGDLLDAEEEARSLSGELSFFTSCQRDHE